MLRLISCVLLSVSVQSERVEIREADLDSSKVESDSIDGVDLEETMLANESFIPKKLQLKKVEEAEAKFRGGDWPILLPGEVVEYAFKNGQGPMRNDWLLFTNWRSIDCDATTSAGKIVKMRFTSRLWHAYDAASVSTAGKFDTDCEVKLFPNGPQWDFAKTSVDRKKLFEILAYVNKKIDGTYTTRQSLLKSGASKALVKNWWFGRVPSLASKLQPSEKSDADMLGEAAEILDKDEKVLYKFEERKRIGRADELMVTNKKLVKIDRASASKTRLTYDLYPYPPGANLFSYIHEWYVETTGKGLRGGLDRDCEMAAVSYFDYKQQVVLADGTTVPGPWKTLSLRFSSRQVDESKLFEYHSTLQENIAKQLNFKR